jgi:hypothetical protein
VPRDANLEDMDKKSGNELELFAIQVMARELKEPLSVALGVLNLFGDIKVAAERSPKALFVTTRLLRRIQNDLRCCVLLAERGYPMQALTLASSIYEGWVTIGSIKSEQEAEKWLNHKNEKASFGKISNLTYEALKAMVGNSDRAKEMYSQYQQLCMAKHLNPVIERAGGFDPGPDTSQPAIMEGWRVLERTSAMAFFAILTAIDNEEPSLDIQEKANRVKTALDDLRAMCRNRWPQNFPTGE